MTALALIFTLAAIGISVTAYLIEKRKKEEVPVCFIGQDCHSVLSSKYNKTLGVHNDVLGFAYYHFEIVLVGTLVLGINSGFPLVNLAYFTILIGALISVYFTFIQWRILKAWCFWCLMSAFTTWGMALTLFVNQLTS